MSQEFLVFQLKSNQLSSSKIQMKNSSNLAVKLKSSIFFFFLLGNLSISVSNTVKALAFEIRGLAL